MEVARREVDRAAVCLVGVAVGVEGPDGDRVDDGPGGGGGGHAGDREVRRRPRGDSDRGARPVERVLAESVPVMDWLPAVFMMALNTPPPLLSVESRAGRRPVGRGEMDGACVSIAVLPNASSGRDRSSSNGVPAVR